MPRSRTELKHGTQYKYIRDKCRCELCVENQKKLAIAARARRTELINSLKSSPCLDCGGSFPPECMDFDHRPGEEKRLEIGEKHRYRLADILEEIKKCDLVCANCHRTRTKNRRSM